MRAPTFALSRGISSVWSDIMRKFVSDRCVYVNVIVLLGH